MGIYGSLAHKLIQKSNTVAIEIYIDSDLYKELLESSISILQENVKAKITINKDGKNIEISIRDKVTMNRSGDAGQHSCSIKLTKPKAIFGNGVDIIIPGKGNQDPYVDPNTSNKLKKGKSYPEEVQIGLDFAKKFKKNLGLIYDKPENQYNQYKLLEEILSKTDNLSKVDISGEDCDIKSKLISKYGKKKG